ncbi:MAG: MBL fold metallo-hydrolase [Promethearchaeota archaeon]
MPRITYLGQSGFYLETPVCKFLIDPRNKESGDLDGDLVYCTHSHLDHTGGVKTFLERNPDAVFICNEQVAERFPQFSDPVQIVGDGDTFEIKSCKFCFTRLRHGVFGSVFNLAVEVKVGDFIFAHCGDAVSFDGFPSSSVSVLVIPIGGGFSANPKKAMNMILSIPEPTPTIVPMHWLFRNPKNFCKKLRSIRADVNCIVPKNGEPLRGYE